VHDHDYAETTAAGVEAIVRLCRRRGTVGILMQDNPDPDALGSAMALRALVQTLTGKRAAIIFRGVCGRAENRAMMRLLNIDARQVEHTELKSFKTLCLVDVQPHAGNVGFFKSRAPDIVIDHHVLPDKKMWKAEFSDVRPHYGATTTILYEYLTAAGIKPNADLATAMFYGIQSDTQSLGRDAYPADIHAYQALFLLADKSKLARIHRAPVPMEYFQMLSDALEHGIVAGKTVISFMPRAYPAEMIAEVADLLMRLEGIRTAVVYGLHAGMIHLSVRSVDARGNAVNRIRRVVRDIGSGGGHGSIAGGQIPIKGDPQKLVALVQQRILDAFAQKKAIIPLVAHPANITRP